MNISLHVTRLNAVAAKHVCYAVLDLFQNKNVSVYARTVHPLNGIDCVVSPFLLFRISSAYKSRSEFVIQGYV